MNIEAVKKIFTPNFGEFEKKILKVNLLTYLIVAGATFLYSLLALFFPAEGTVMQKILVMIFSPLISLIICVLVAVYVFVLYVINLFGVKASQYSNWFNLVSSFILLVLQVFVVLGAYIGFLIQMPILAALSELVMQYMILFVFFIIVMNLFYATGVGIVNFVKTIRKN